MHEVHERELDAPPAVTGALLDHPERMWPSDRWPELRPGGIGFLRHELLEHRPGERLFFRITGPRGLTGMHGWEVRPLNGHTLLRHTVDAECTGAASLGWRVAIQPIHAALHEDVLDRAETLVRGSPAGHEWSRRVRLLRWAIRKAGLAGD